MSEPVFLVDAAGIFSRDQLRLIWRDEPAAAHPALQELVERTWAQQLEECRCKDITLFNGALVRYLRHERRGDLLTIDVGATDYRAFIGTNFLNYGRASEFGWDAFSNPIGTSASVITQDGWILLGRRNERVACLPGYLHTFGGGLELDDRRPDGTCDAFLSLERELREELQLEGEHINRSLCLGLIRDPQIRQPELVFDTYVRRTREEMEGCLRCDDPDEEHAGIVACRDEPDAIVPFIQASDRIAPIAIGGLCLHGQVVFGASWYAQAMKTLST